MSPAPLVIVGCGASKRSHRSPAGDLYLGGYHQACRTVAAAVTRPDRTLILSALHGLLSLDDHVEPYDLRMGARGCVTPLQVREQARVRDLLDEKVVVVLAGSQYAAVVREVWPGAHTPLEGVGGMGKQLAALKRFAEDPAAILPYTAPTPDAGLVRPGLAVESVPGVGPKNGGRYGGTLVAVAARTAVVDCWDGQQRRMPLDDLQLWAPPILLAAWKHLGYVDPATGRAVTDEWMWLGWTLAEHQQHQAAIDRI